MFEGWGEKGPAGRTEEWKSNSVSVLYLLHRVDFAFDCKRGKGGCIPGHWFCVPSLNDLRVYLSRELWPSNLEIVVWGGQFCNHRLEAQIKHETNKKKKSKF